MIMIQYNQRLKNVQLDSYAVNDDGNERMFFHIGKLCVVLQFLKPPTTSKSLTSSVDCVSRTH